MELVNLNGPATTEDVRRNDQRVSDASSSRRSQSRILLRGAPRRRGSDSRTLSTTATAAALDRSRFACPSMTENHRCHYRLCAPFLTRSRAGSGRHFGLAAPRYRWLRLASDPLDDGRNRAQGHRAGRERAHSDPDDGQGNDHRLRTAAMGAPSGCYRGSVRSKDTRIQTGNQQFVVRLVAFCSLLRPP